MNIDNETIADIVRDMRTVKLYKQTDETAMFWLGRYADRIEAAHKRLIAYDAKREADFAALMADRNALAEKNRACCDENERLREALDKIEDQVRWTIAHIECDELDDATGALYTAHAALEYVNRAKGANA